MDNAEYYEKYPDISKSTIRSWKSRVRTKPIEEEIPEEVITKFEGAEENEKYLIQMLMNQTGTKASEFSGVDNRSKLLILKNRKRTQDEEKKNKKTGSNSSIMPQTAAIGNVIEGIGLTKYIEFDNNLNEIRMEIPLDKLLSPEENKVLRT